MDNQQQKRPQPDGLTDKQNRLLSILVETPSITEAAQIAGISRSTAQRWIKSPVFERKLTALRKTAVQQAMSSLHSHTAKAANGLVRLMDSSNEWIQRQVCMDILNRSLKIREVEELEERVSALEQAAEHQKTNQTGRRRQ